MADAGYGSEENYDSLSKAGIEYYIPYPSFRKEQSKKFKDNPFHPQNLFYNADLDFLVCPMGQKMEKKYVKKSTTDNGFEQTSTIYEAKNCQGCPLRAMCHKSKENRQIAINHKLNAFKATAKEQLTSDKGKEIYKKTLH